MVTGLHLVQPASEEHLRQVRELFEEYAASLGFDLGFQGFEQELRRLPGEYAPPDGRLLLALADGHAAGCIALRRIENGTCEMKRMYVRPRFRGQGIGRSLAVAIMGEARNAGYRRMRLDTISWMGEALAIYRSLGFREIEPYRFNPIEGAIFLELDLEGNPPAGGGASGSA